MDERMKEKMKLSRKLAAFLGRAEGNKGISKEEIEQYMKLVSTDVSNAIGGLNEYNSPFVLRILDMYVRGIEKQFPMARSIAEAMDKFMGSTEITMMMPIKREEDEDDGSEGEV